MLMNKCDEQYTVVAGLTVLAPAGQMKHQSTGSLVKSTVFPR